MPDDEPDEPTQRTPQGDERTFEDDHARDVEGGLEIPIPDKSEWDNLLGKVAKGVGGNGADHKKGDQPE